MKKRNYSKSIANSINNFLTEDDWHFSFDEQRGLFDFGLYLSGRIKKINYVIDVKENEYIVYAISPLGVDGNDKKMMASMTEFICRVNYGLKNGNFELDMRDGEIRFKSFVDCEGITPTLQMVKNSIYCPAVMFDHYGDGIVDIILGNTTPKYAISKCEMIPSEELGVLLDEEIAEDEDEDIETMIARIAARCDGGDKNLRSDCEQPESTDGDARIKTELFKPKGGAV